LAQPAFVAYWAQVADALATWAAVLGPGTARGAMSTGCFPVGAVAAIRANWPPDVAVSVLDAYAGRPIARPVTATGIAILAAREIRTRNHLSRYSRCSRLISKRVL
jgi:hypothetical protein